MSLQIEDALTVFYVLTYAVSYSLPHVLVESMKSSWSLWNSMDFLMESTEFLTESTGILMKSKEFHGTP
jgi:hypothetical protein